MPFKEEMRDFHADNHSNIVVASTENFLFSSESVGEGHPGIMLLIIHNSYYR